MFAGLGLPENNHIVDLITGFPHVHTAEELSKHLFTYLSNTPTLRFYSIKACQSQLGPPSSSRSGSHAPHTAVLGIMGYRTDERSLTVKLDDFLFSPVLQNSYASIEAHYLLLRHLFEGQPMECRRVWFTTNSVNVKARGHTEKLGYKYEGTFRKDTITRWGTSRNSDCLSMLDNEWPLNKKVMERWLLAANFDTDGKHIKSLQDVRALHLRSSL